MLFDYGLEQARRLDKFYKCHGKTFGPLHGLPLSVKDCFDVERADSAMGWAALLGQPKVTSVRLVQKLQAAGAVIYCKTTVPRK